MAPAVVDAPAVARAVALALARPPELDVVISGTTVPTHPCPDTLRTCWSPSASRTPRGSNGGMFPTSAGYDRTSPRTSYGVSRSVMLFIRASEMCHLQTPASSESLAGWMSCSRRLFSGVPTSGRSPHRRRCCGWPSMIWRRGCGVRFRYSRRTGSFSRSVTWGGGSGGLHLMYDGVHHRQRKQRDHDSEVLAALQHGGGRVIRVTAGNLASMAEIEKPRERVVGAPE